MMLRDIGHIILKKVMGMITLYLAMQKKEKIGIF